MEGDSIQLGGSIELSGFSEFGGGDMVIIKKIVGNHVKKITELSKEFKSIKIHLKTIHETTEPKKFEFHVTLLSDKQYNAEAVERNLYIGIDKVLKKVISLIS